MNTTLACDFVVIFRTTLLNRPENGFVEICLEFVQKVGAFQKKFSNPLLNRPQKGVLEGQISLSTSYIAIFWAKKQICRKLRKEWPFFGLKVRFLEDFFENFVNISENIALENAITVDFGSSENFFHISLMNCPKMGFQGSNFYPLSSKYLAIVQG